MLNLLLWIFRGMWVGVRVGAVVLWKNLRFFEPDQKLSHVPRRKHCTCILEGHLSIDPILSALHLQGLESDLYVYFHLVNKQFDWDCIPEVKPSVKHVLNLEVNNITKSLLAFRLSFLWLTIWRGLCQSKKKLKLMPWARWHLPMGPSRPGHVSFVAQRTSSTARGNKFQYLGCHARPHGAHNSRQCFFFWTQPKTVARPPNFEKTIVLAFLNAAYPQISCWVHFTFKVPNPIYMFTSIEQISNWVGFYFQSETTNKTCNQFGSQKYYKTLISTKFIIFVTIAGVFVILKWN